MENSSRCLADAEIEALLDSIDSDVSFTEDNLEEEVDFDSDDSLEDPDYSPEFQENTFEEELMKAVESAQNMASEKENKGPPAKKQKSAPTVQLQLNDIEDVSSPNTLLGRNGHVWSSNPVHRSSGKTMAMNVVYIRPGPYPGAKDAIEPIDAFGLIFNDEILNEVLLRTNEKIAQLREKYKIKDCTVSDTNLCELKALLGLIFLSATLKNNHLTTDVLFDPTYSGDRYKATMSRNRFNFLINALRFDNQLTREERMKETVFAPISMIWDIFINNCTKSYKPGSYVTIDEQLVGFRGRCPFRMYMPNKPNKYGIKIVMLCDVATKYVINASPYLGKSTKTNGAPLANYFVENLTKPLHGSHRSVTMDNWFTSIPLAQKLLANPYKLTIVGTLRKNKAEIPAELLETKSRPNGSSMFAFDKEMTMVSYKPKQNKNVMLLSTMHITGALNEVTSKPEIIHSYNSTKGAVDTFDQMAQNISCNRKTRRWPLCTFYNMLNIASVNSYVIYTHNVMEKGLKPLNRTKYMLKLHEQLTGPWQQERLDNIPNLPRELKNSIGNILKIKETGTVSEASSSKGKRTYCKFCHYSKKRMTTTYCSICDEAALCGEHQIKICQECKQNFA